MKKSEDMPVVLETRLTDLGAKKSGKVRDIYDLGDKLLLVATDRISAFDVILPNGIPDKGYVLTQMSKFWFDWLWQMEDVVPHHLITTVVSEFPQPCQNYLDVLQGRSMLVRKVSPLPVECIVRGYLSGSGWKEYKESGKVCGQTLGKCLLESAQLPKPIFTPSTKATEGHDINISFEQMEKLVGGAVAKEAKEASLKIYERAAVLAAERGIIIADTKFEFGLDPEAGYLVLIDEVLTPDSSRFWPKDSYAPGHPQPSFDKQYVRDYLDSIGWDRRPPAPTLPEEVIRQTSQKYREALERITRR